jgi:5'-nucleotidase
VQDLFIGDILKGVSMKQYGIFALAFGLCFLFFSCSQKTSSSLKNGKLTIIYSGNNGAKIDVCGCRIPKGGLAKRATLISQTREKDRNALILDSGALIYDTNKLTPPLEDNARRRASLTINVVKKTGIDAANIGSMDLANTADSLLSLKERGLPWLSANLAWKNSGNLLFPPDTLRTVGSFKVGIFGFMDQNSSGVAFFDETSPLKVLDPSETVRKEVEKLRTQSDIVIALAYMDLDRVQKLVQNVPGIDLVIVSHSHEHSQNSEHPFFEPLKTGKTLIARCPDGGRVMGVLELDVVNGVTDFVDANAVKDLRPEAVKKADKKPRTVSIWVNNFYDLDYRIPSNKEVQDQIDNVVKLNDDFLRTMKTR